MIYSSPHYAYMYKIVKSTQADHFAAVKEPCGQTHRRTRHHPCSHCPSSLNSQLVNMNIYSGMSEQSKACSSICSCPCITSWNTAKLLVYTHDVSHLGTSQSNAGSMGCQWPKKGDLHENRSVGLKAPKTSDGTLLKPQLDWTSTKSQV